MMIAPAPASAPTPAAAAPATPTPSAATPAPAPAAAAAPSAVSWQAAGTANLYGGSGDVASQLAHQAFTRLVNNIASRHDVVGTLDKFAYEHPSWWNSHGDVALGGRFIGPVEHARAAAAEVVANLNRQLGLQGSVTA